MNRKFDREKLNRGVRKAQDRSYRTKDERGGGGTYSYDLEATGLPIYKPNSDPDKPNKLAFLSWFPGDNDPIQNKRDEEEKEYTYILDFYDHSLKGVGRFVCMNSTYNKKCPICEYTRANQLEKDDWMALRAIRRGVYAVWDLADKSAGPKVWYTPFKSIEERVQKAAVDLETGDTIYYTDADEGSNLYFIFEDKGNYKYEYSNFQLKKRKDPLPQSLFEKVPSMDEFLNIPSYEDVQIALSTFLGHEVVGKELDKIKEEYDDEDEEEKPKSKKPKKIECPADDGKFGVTFNQIDECDDCNFFSECGNKYEELEEEKEEEKPKQSSKKEEYEDEDDEDEKPLNKPERKPLRRRA